MIRASPVVCEHYDVLQVENKDVMGQFIGVESLLLSTILHFELFIKVNWIVQFAALMPQFDTLRFQIFTKLFYRIFHKSRSKPKRLPRGVAVTQLFQVRALEGESMK